MSKKVFIFVIIHKSTTPDSGPHINANKLNHIKFHCSWFNVILKHWRIAQGLKTVCGSLRFTFLVIVEVFCKKVFLFCILRRSLQCQRQSQKQPKGSNHQAHILVFQDKTEAMVKTKLLDPVFLDVLLFLTYSRHTQPHRILLPSYSTKWLRYSVDWKIQPTIWKDSLAFSKSNLLVLNNALVWFLVQVHIIPVSGITKRSKSSLLNPLNNTASSPLNDDYLHLWIQDWTVGLHWKSDDVPRCTMCRVAVGHRNNASWPRYTPAGASEHSISPTKRILTACGPTPSFQLSKSTGGPFPQRPRDFEMKTSTSISTGVRVGTTMTQVQTLWSYFLIVDSLLRNGFLFLGPLSTYYQLQARKKESFSRFQQKKTSVYRLLKQKPVRNWFYMFKHACNTADARHEIITIVLCRPAYGQFAKQDKEQQ